MRLIDADKLIHDIDREATNLMECFCVIEDQPTIERKGRWEEITGGTYEGVKCSNCGCGFNKKFYPLAYEFKFCPECGAKMEVENDN